MPLTHGITLSLFMAPLVFMPGIGSAESLDDSPISVQFWSAEGEITTMYAHPVEGRDLTYALDLEGLESKAEATGEARKTRRPTNMRLEAGILGHNDEPAELHLGNELTLCMEWTSELDPMVILGTSAYGMGQFTFIMEGAWDKKWRLIFPLGFLQIWNPPGLCMSPVVVEGGLGEGTYTARLDIASQNIYNNEDSFDFVITGPSE